LSFAVVAAEHNDTDAAIGGTKSVSYLSFIFSTKFTGWRHFIDNQIALADGVVLTPWSFDALFDMDLISRGSLLWVGPGMRLGLGQIYLAERSSGSGW